MRAPDHLEAGAKTFRERNLIYGDNYLGIGKVFDALFPDGLTIKGSKEWDIFLAFINCQLKTMRLAAHFTREKEGHEDSAHDLAVYAAMLSEIIDKNKGEKHG